MQNKNVKLMNVFKLIANIILYSIISLFAAFVVSGFTYPVRNAALNILQNPAGYHLWFLYVLLLCYLFFSLLSVKKIPPLKAVVISVVIFIFFNEQTNSFTSFFGVNYKGIFALKDGLFFYLVYASLGVFIGNAKINPKHKLCFFLGFVSASSAISILTYFRSSYNNEIYKDFYSYTSILVMLSSVFLFCYLKSFHESFLIFGKFTTLLSSVALPVYGIHAIILGLMTSIRPHNIILDIPITLTVVIVTSILFGVMIRRFDRFKIFS